MTDSETSASDLDTQLIIHDAIHGSYSLPELAWIIIDTMEFQRLRGIKQTGNTCYVYPGAEHTRFQHCIGVAHLALEFGQAIKSKDPNIISDHHILLLCLAGLCHDLGHCAYSHLYDNYIIPMFNKDQLVTDDDFIECHEQASYLILKRIWKRVSALNEPVTGLQESDIKIIGKMILGSPDKVPQSLKEELKWTEWDLENQFIYEVVSNDRTGIDVDKFDYLKRDSHYTGIPCTFDPQRLMTFLSLKQRKGQCVVDYLRKSDELIKSMWLSRDDLHRRAYQHRVVKCLDMMTIDMFRYCADAKIPGTDTKLRDAHRDLDSYLRLTDSKIISMVEGVPEANEILKRIQSRNLWDTIATVISIKPLDFEFKANIRTCEAKFRDDFVYYIYHTGHDNIDAQFFVDLITQSDGAEINLRIKPQTRWLRVLV